MRQKIGFKQPQKEVWLQGQALKNSRGDNWLQHPTNINRYFNSLIDFLLAYQPTLQGSKNGQRMCYIRNDIIENQLLEILKYDQSQFWQVVGYKGTGKSTTLRGCFDLWDGSGVSKIFRNTLVIYCSFNSVDIAYDASLNNTSLAVRRVIEGHIYDALHNIREEHHARGGKLITDYQFYLFLKETRGDLLYRWPEVGGSDTPEYMAQLAGLKCSDRMTYGAVRLKYEVSQLFTASEEIESDDAGWNKQVLFIFDDIEGLPNIEARISLINMFAPLWCCFRNGVSFPLKILIAQRPHTRDELIRSQIWNSTTNIEFKNPLTLSELLQHKSRVFFEHDPKGQKLKNRDTFDESYTALMSLLTRYKERDQEEIILALSNRCFRDSLTRLACCLQSFHGDTSSQISAFQGAFKLSGNWKNWTRADLLEALGRRGYDYFSPNEKNGIPNIFENCHEDSSCDFLILVIVHWGIQQTSNFQSDWPRLIDFFTLEVYLKKSLPGSNLEQRLPWAIDRCVALGFIDQVVDQSNPSKILYHIMPRAELLYHELKNNSSLVGLCYSEFYLDDPHLSTFRNETRGHFMRVLRFCGYICKFEAELLEEAIETDVLWVKIFHRNLLSTHVLTGIETTWDRWGGEKPADAFKELERLRKLVKETEKTYVRT